MNKSPNDKALLDLMREHYFAAAKQPGKVSMDTTMQQLGADDLDLVETAMAAEDRFGVDIPDNIVSPSMTPRTLLEYIKAVKAAEEWKKRNYPVKSANMSALEKVADLNLEYVDPASMPHNRNTQEWEPVTIIGPRRGEMETVASRIGASPVNSKYDIDNTRALGAAYQGASPEEVRRLIDTANAIRAKSTSTYGMTPAPYTTHVDNTEDAVKRVPGIRGLNKAVFYDAAHGVVPTKEPVHSFVHMGGSDKTNAYMRKGINGVFNGHIHPNTKTNATDLETQHTSLGHEITHVLNHVPRNASDDFPAKLQRIYDNHRGYAQANNYDVAAMGGTTYNGARKGEAVQGAAQVKRLAYGLFRDRYGRLPGLGKEDDAALRSAYMEAGRQNYNTEQVRGLHELTPAGGSGKEAEDGYNKNYGELINSLMERDENGYRHGDALVNSRNGTGRMYKSANIAGLEKMAVEFGIMVDPTRLAQQRPSRAYESVPDNLDVMNSTDDVRDRLGPWASAWRILGGGLLGAGAGAIAGTNGMVSSPSGVQPTIDRSQDALAGALLGGLGGSALAWYIDRKRRLNVYNQAVDAGLVADPEEAAQLYGTKGKTWQDKYNEAKRKQRGF